MPAGVPFTRSLAKYIIESYVGMRIAPTTEKTPAKNILSVLAFGV